MEYAVEGQLIDQSVYGYRMRHAVEMASKRLLEELRAANNADTPEIAARYAALQIVKDDLRTLTEMEMRVVDGD